ncbi:murein tripeptide amidase MpaA [Vibrio sp.]|nr:murein tripeptide amidase MpaA [Vibrio sp.]
MTQRPIPERGTFDEFPKQYGASTLGAPLLYFPAKHRNKETGLIFAGMHGDESMSISLLSCALRSIQLHHLKHDIILSTNPDGNQLGLRSNANGVDLNRAFPTKNWAKGGTVYRWDSKQKERNVNIGTGSATPREPEVDALCQFIHHHKPKFIVSIHEPLACVDVDAPCNLSHWLSERMNLPLVSGAGYETPGSFGTWCHEQGYHCITLELPAISFDEATGIYIDTLSQLLTYPNQDTMTS